MNVWAVVPVKPFGEGKTRLATILGAHERHILNHTFLENTLRTALCVFPASRIVIVSRAPDVRAMAQTCGAWALDEEDTGLNAALETGARHAHKADAAAVLSLSTDLPLLTPDDLWAMLNAPSSPAAVIAPDRRDTGTNGMLLNPIGLMRYAYGPDSFAVHARAATAVHGALKVVDRPGLRLDIDTPDDWRYWQACRGGRGQQKHGAA